MIEFASVAVFWIVIAGLIVTRARKSLNNRPGRHPTEINTSSTKERDLNRAGTGKKRKTVSSDGHTIPKSRDITCEGQYGHRHEGMEERYIVHEEPTEGYCILNGKKVALKDCWKY